MKAHILLLLPAALALFLAGCSDAGKKPAAPDEDDIRENLAKLSPEDRQLAEAQRWCAVESDNRLGTMGAPFKVEVKGKPVLLCCKGCRKEALADPDRTLTRVEELKAKKQSQSPR